MGYKMNLSKEKNKFYNKDLLKEEGQKRKRKENEKRKTTMVKAHKA